MKIDVKEYKQFLTKVCKAYTALEEVRECLEEFESAKGSKFPSFFNSEHIDDCQSTLEKQIGWDLLSKPKYLGLEEIKKEDV